MAIGKRRSKSNKGGGVRKRVRTKWFGSGYFKGQRSVSTTPHHSKARATKNKHNRTRSGGRSKRTRK